MLELFLAYNCLPNVWKGLKIDALGAVVFMGKHGDKAFCVLVNATLQTIGYTDVKDAIGDVGHEIDVSMGAHNQQLGRLPEILINLD